MRLDHLLSKEFFSGSQLWALFFYVVDVAECATATKVFLPGGDTPSGYGGTASMVVRLACEGLCAHVVLVGWSHRFA